MPVTVKQIRLLGRPEFSQSRLMELLNYNPKKGNWVWNNGRGGQAAASPAGTLANGYRQIFIEYWAWRSARLAWLYQTGSFPSDGYYVDHINGNRSDDRWCNLRLATPQQNARNRRPWPGNTSGKVGVHPIKSSGLWGAEIGLNNRNIKLGAFECKADAIAARCEAERHYFGEFAADAARYSDGQ